MSSEPGLAAARRYYLRAEEQDRLAAGAGEVEFERTKEIVLRQLPAAPATVADIGGGPGRYALWLAGLGYQVIHRDLMPLHVTQLQQAAQGLPGIDSAVADARDLDLPDGCADAVLLLGPLYHLQHRPDRLRALAQARRILRPGAPLFAAVISRWAARLDGILRSRLDRDYPHAIEQVGFLERTGQLRPLHPAAFCGYTHRPAQLRAELTASGLRVTDLVAVEGPTFLLADLAERMAEPDGRQVVLDTIRATERVPELLGATPHLLATAVPAG